MKTETPCEQEARRFLEDTGSTLDIRFLATDYYFPGDTARRDIYRFTLTCNGRMYTAKFGQSLRNSGKFHHFRGPEHGLCHKLCEAYVCSGPYRADFVRNPNFCVPSSYDILAALDPYIVDGMDIDEFAKNYGGGSISETLARYSACLDERRGLRMMYDDTALDLLAEIY